MRITILTTGSRGDVEPFIALGAGLRVRGHEVRLATHRRFWPMAEGLDFEVCDVAGDPLALLAAEPGQRWLSAGRNTLAFLKRLGDVAQPVAAQVLNDYVAASEGADLLLFPALAAIPALSIAERYRIAALPAFLQHAHPTGAYPSAVVPPHPALGAVYNRLSYPIAGQLFWQLMRRPLNQWRTRELGLTPYEVRGPASQLLKSRRPALYGFSPFVVPRPVEWGREVKMTGYWLLETSSSWRPPTRLLEFLDAGPPPVFVGFGSMAERGMPATAHLVVEALARSGQRGLLLRGWGGLDSKDLPESVLMIEEAPFEWLLPQTAAVVHHGGAGTTGIGLRAGVPTIVVPFFADQYFWAWRVQTLGVGPPAIPYRQLTVAKLAVAIQRAMTDGAMRRRAAHLGQLLCTEDGVAQAVIEIEHLTTNDLCAVAR